MKHFLPIMIMMALVSTSLLSKAQCNVTIISNDSTICNGDSTTLTAVIPLSCPTLSYSWAPVNGTNTFIDVKPTTTTTYIVTAADPNGNAYVDSFTVFVVNCSGGCGVIASTQNDILCIGDTTTLMAMSPSDCIQPVTYTWMPGPIMGQHISVNPTVTTTYTVTGTDGTATTYVDSVTITVTNCNNCTITIFGPDTLCNGGSATLTASSQSACPTLVMTWMPGNFSGNFVTVSPTATTTYTVSGSDGVNTFTDTFTVNVITCTGIKEEAGITEFHAFINRAEEKITVTFSTNNTRVIETNFVSIAGQVLKTTQLQQNNTGLYQQTYSTAGLAPGIYFISIQTEKGILSNKVAIH